MTDERFKLGDKLGGGPPPPEGTYTLQLLSWEEGVTAENKPMVRLRWEIKDGQHAGRQVLDTITVTPEAIFKACMILDACGRDHETVYESCADCATDLIRTLETGIPVTGVLVHRKFIKDGVEKTYGNIVMYARHIPVAEQ